MSCRSDLELASSSSGLQLSGTISPPPSSKGSRGRGRGRSRSRGSVRLAAPDSRIGQVKDEQESASPAQTMPDATPAKPAETSTDFQIKTEAHATDAAMPQAQSSDLESLSRGVQSHDRVPAADMLAVKHEQPAMQVPGGQQMPQVTPNPASEQAQALPVTQPQIPDMPFLTAATTLKRSEIAVEEDDYDADD